MGLAGLAGVAGFLIAFAGTPLSTRLAHRFGAIDHPTGEEHKAHDDPTPYLGGIALFAACVLGSLVLFRLGNPAGRADLFVALGLAIGLGVIGLVDDVRKLPPGARLLFQIGAALIAWNAGFEVHLTQVDPIDAVLSLVWIVGITNAFNLLDNMDGLSAGLAGIAAAIFSVLSLIGELEALSIVSASLSGACFGFLVHNRHPARVFMGDSGSLFLGFLLACIGVRLRFDNLLQVTFLIPVVVLAVPILDTSVVVISRMIGGQSPLRGGRDHVSHRLVNVGLSVRTAVYALYLMGLCLGWIGIVMSQADARVGWMLIALVGLVGVVLIITLLRVPVYEASVQERLAVASAEYEEPDEASVFQRWRARLASRN